MGKKTRVFIVLLAMLMSGITVAQALPLFGTATFGNAVFGAASTPNAVPVLPFWMLALLTTSLWALSYFAKPGARTDR